MKRLFIMVLTLLLLSGCTHLISEKSRMQADHSVTFRSLQENPDAFKGKFILLGGLITGIKQVPEGYQLEVIEYRLDSEEMPDTSARSDGRFLVIIPPDVGPATFRPGMLISVAGEVAGKTVKPLEHTEYTYPVLVVKEIHIIVVPPGRYPVGGY
jgi:outer membrane lipoprotein